MPNAIEYGMTPEQFWFDDMRLFDVYKKAYYKRLHNQSFVQAQYFDYALAVEISNMWLKKGQKPAEFLKEPLNPFKEQETKSDLEKDLDYRQKLMQWI